MSSGLVICRSKDNNESYLKSSFTISIPHNVRSCTDICLCCGALHWLAERTLGDQTKFRASYTACCHKGKVQVPIQYDGSNYPVFLRNILEGDDAESKRFQEQIRAYNSALSFVSLGANVDRSTQGHSGIFSFRISGSLYHQIGSIFPPIGQTPAFSQIYVVGGDDLEEARVRREQSRVQLNLVLLLQIQQYLSTNNCYAQFYRSLSEYENENNVPVFVLKSIEGPNLDLRVYNKPSVSEVAMVIATDDDIAIPPRSLVLHKRNGDLKMVTDEYSGYLSLQYVLFFPHGQPGWIRGIELSDNEHRPISQCEWYASLH